ncbi:right-handed parallel beta-helix repeat-containing protein [Planctomycetota bacterium]
MISIPVLLFSIACQLPHLSPAQVFQPDHVSLSNHFEHSCSISPDGYELVFTREPGMIYLAHKTPDGWGNPSSFLEGRGAVFTPDGQGILYSGPGGDLYRVFKMESGWSTPHKMPAPINTAAFEYGASMTRDGTLYFFRATHNKTVLLRAPLDGHSYGQAQEIRLSNDPQRFSVSHGTIDPDEHFMVFDMSGHPEGYGDNDIYVAFRDPNGSWSDPVHLGNTVNSPVTESGPTLSGDGRTLFFTRSAPDAYGQRGDIYAVKTTVIEQARDRLNNLPIKNSTTNKAYPSIQSAIVRAQSHHRIVIPAGYFYENLNLSCKDIVLQSLDPNDPYTIGGTIIQGHTNTPVLSLSNNTEVCTIAGLTLRAGSVGVSGTTTHATLYNCRMLDNGFHGLELFEQSNPHLDHCLITANGTSGMTMHGFSFRNRLLPCEPQLTHCFIVDNNDLSIVGGEPVILDSVIQ